MFNGMQEKNFVLQIIKNIIYKQIYKRTSQKTYMHVDLTLGGTLKSRSEKTSAKIL